MSQVLPPDEDFADPGSNPYGSTPTSWFRVVPWTSDPGYGSGGTEFTDATFLDSQHALSDSYGSTKASSGSAVITTQTHDDISNPTGGSPVSDGWPKMGGWAFRRALLEDVDVRAGFTYKSAGFTVNVGSQRYYAIGCRISGGSISDSGDRDLERLTGADGYWFARLAQGPVSTVEGTKYVLFRVKAGVITRLAESPSGQGNLHPYLVAGSFGLRLTARTLPSGNVQLRAYVRGGLEDSSDPSVTLRGTEWMPIMQYQDAHADKIDVAGRCGFGMTAERNNITQQFAHLCTYCEGRPYEGELLFRDEWLRPHRRNAMFVAGQGTSSSVAGLVQGHSLANLWSGDLFGVWDPVGGGSGSGGPGGTIEIVSGRARFAAGDPTDYPGWLPQITNQPVADPVEQRRSVTVRFLSTGTTNDDHPRVVGIIERERASNAYSNIFTGRGYVIWLAYDDDGAAWEAGVVAMNAQLGIWNLLAYTTVAGLSLDSDIDLDVELTNIDGPSQVTNAVQIRAWIDDVQVAFGPGTDGASSSVRLAGNALTPITLGVTVDSNGTVVDERSDRLENGVAEGLLITNTGEGGGDRPIEVDDWAMGTPVEPEDPPPPPESDQATLSIATACPVPPSETLVFPHTWPVTQEVTGRSKVHRFETFHSVRILEDPGQPRAWIVEAGAMTVVERDALRAFFDSMGGILLPFYWETPEGETVSVAMEDDAIEDVLHNRGAHRARIRLVEC